MLQVDPGPYVDTCLYVYCSLGTNEREAAVCDTLASYARECAQQHVILSWRGPGLCGMTLISFTENPTNLQNEYSSLFPDNAISVLYIN